MKPAWRLMGTLAVAALIAVTVRGPQSRGGTTAGAVPRPSLGRGRLEEAHSMELAAKIPWFGGWYMDAPGDVHVWLTDMKHASAARAVVAAELRGMAMSREQKPHPDVIVHQGRFTWDQLSAWREVLEAVIGDLPEVVWWDIQESRNLIEIGVRPRDVIPGVRAKLERLGIPAGATDLSAAACDEAGVECGGR